MLDFAADPASSPFGGVDRSGYADHIALAIQAMRDARMPVDRFCVDANNYAFQADFGDVTLRLPAMPRCPGKIVGVARDLLERRHSPYIRKHQANAAGDLSLDAGVPELAIHLGIDPARLAEAVALVRARPRAMITSTGPLVPADCAVHVDGLRLVRQGRRIIGFMRDDAFSVGGDTITILRPVTLPETVVGSLAGRRLGSLLAGLPVWASATVRKTWSSAGRLNLQVEPRPLAA